MNLQQIDQNSVTINHVKYPYPKNPFGGSVSVINGNKVYANYRELKDGEWKITIMSIIRCLFC